MFLVMPMSAIPITISQGKLMMTCKGVAQGWAYSEIHDYYTYTIVTLLQWTGLRERRVRAGNGSKAPSMPRSILRVRIVIA